MLRDIDFRKVHNLAMAAVPEEEEGSTIWKVYLVNLENNPIENVLISSKGYGKKDEEEVKTSELRQHFDQINGADYVVVELLTEELLQINHQFWVSFWLNGELYDKKYIFLSESLNEQFFAEVPLLGKPGVLIK